ncbi:hypothetical protein ACQP2U_42845 (plasmid) [Nocardia sp. CA-084685]|uniref:hypothetical protein n=1 Tax=Nocardia sp. CA-084685 TaxID=3239970 RepID=UPI003D98FFA6
MQHNDGSLSIAQARVLRALRCGGMLTNRQIEASAGLAKWMTRRTIADLTRRDLIFAGLLRDHPIGPNTLAAKSPDFGRLEPRHG